MSIPRNVWHAIAYKVAELQMDAQGFFQGYGISDVNAAFRALTFCESGWNPDAGGVCEGVHCWSGSDDHGIWQMHGPVRGGGFIGPASLNAIAQGLGLGNSGDLITHTIWYITHTVIREINLRGASAMTGWCTWSYAACGGHGRPCVQNSWRSYRDPAIGGAVHSRYVTYYLGNYGRNSGYTLDVRANPPQVTSGSLFDILVTVTNQADKALLGMMAMLEYPSDSGLQFLGVEGGEGLTFAVNKAWNAVLTAGTEVPVGATRTYRFGFQAPDVGDRSILPQVFVTVYGENMAQSDQQIDVPVGPEAAGIIPLSVMASLSNGSGSTTPVRVRIPSGNAALQVQTVGVQAYAYPAIANRQPVSLRVTNNGQASADSVVLAITGGAFQTINLGSIAPQQSRVYNWAGLPSPTGLVAAMASAPGAIPDTLVLRQEPVAGPPSDSGISPLVLLGGLAAVGGAAYVASRRERG